MKPFASRLRQIAQDGYRLEWLQPAPIARVCAALCGRDLRAIHRFVKSH